MLALAFQKTIASMGRGPILRMVFYSIGLSLVAIALLIGLLSLFISPQELISYFIGLFDATPIEAQTGWFLFARGLLQLVLITFAFMLGIMLFPLIVPLVAGQLADSVVDKVEREEYALHDVPQRALMTDLKAGLKFTLKSVGLNLLCLPLYFIPFVNFLIWVALNGTLMGREFFRMIASRFVALPEEKAAWVRHRWQYQLAGVAILLMGVIPILNLMAPIIGIVLMTHLYQIANAKAKSALIPPTEM